MHSPFPTTAETLEAWTALAQYLPTSTTSPASTTNPTPTLTGRVLRLGISNVTLPTLLALSSSPPLPLPSIIQNRFRAAERHFDLAVRTWCATHGAAYQGFWTLTGNPGIWQQPLQGDGFVARVARGAGVSVAGAWYALLMVRAGVVVLNGTGDGAHMREDLGVVGRVEAWRGTEEGGREWEVCAREFGGLVGDVGGGEGEGVVVEV